MKEGNINFAPGNAPLRCRQLSGLILGIWILFLIAPVSATTWTDTVAASTGGNYCSLALDSSGSPGIGYQASSHLTYSAWNGSGWNVQTVDPASITGSYSSLALTSTGYPRISYSSYVSSVYTLNYAAWNGSGWENQTVETNGIVSSLALDSSNNPRVAYSTTPATGRMLKYASWNGTGWEIQTIEGTNTTYYPSLALDSSNRPRISYIDGTNNLLKYAAWTGTGWEIQTVDSAYGLPQALRLDSAGNPRIAYANYSTSYSTRYPKYAAWTGTGWTTTVIDSSGPSQYISLALDSSGNPRISYSIAPDIPYILKYAALNGNAWDTETLNSTDGRWNSLALDSSGNPRIAYYGSSKLRYASGTPSAPTASSITPSTGANTATVSITDLTGSGFYGTPTVRLSKSGETNITATSVVLVNSSHLRFDLPITGVSAGTWSVTVINPDGQEGTNASVTFTVTAARPTVSFSGTPTSGTVPLPVTFTDHSTGLPTVFSWYFGDEDWTAIGSGWNRVTGSAGWGARRLATGVSLPDGSIVLIGGAESWEGPYYNDVWRSADEGATWSRVNASAGWQARDGSASVALPDGTIVFMGGQWTSMITLSSTFYNDTWRSADQGATWSRVNASSGWPVREGPTSVALPDGTILLMGGYGGWGGYNDTWKSVDDGATWTLVNASSGWPKRYGATSVVLPDGSIVLTGGADSGAMYYNDTWRSVDDGATWTLVNASSGWAARDSHTSVVLPDGSIILMGGESGGDVHYNDTWRSADNGATWTLMNAGAGWEARMGSVSVALPDGCIILMGGGYAEGAYNDVWRLSTASSNLQDPSHTYTAIGTYPVSLGATNTDTGTGTLTRPEYITVTAVSVTVTSISPVYGLTTGSTPVTITGTGFSTAGTTTVNLTKAGYDNVSFTGLVTSSDVLTGTVPAGIPTGTWNVVVVNPDGQEGTNTSVTFTVTSVSPTPTPSLTQSDDTSGDTGRDTSYVATAPGAGAGGTMTFAVNEPLSAGSTVYHYAIIAVSIVPTETLGSTELVVADAGSTSHVPDGRTIAGIAVISPVAVNPSAIGSGTITFAVSADWLSEHGLAPANIVLMRFHDGSWAELPTTYQYQSGDAYYFTATTPGFSYFAIANRISTASTDVTVAKTTVTPVLASSTQAADVTAAAPASVKAASAGTSAPVTTATTAAPVSTGGSSGIPVITIIAGIGGIAVVAVGAVLGRRWWIRRQNPALFRKYD